MKSYTIKRIAQELNINQEAARIVRRIVRGELSRQQLYALSTCVENWAERECYSRPSCAEVAMQVLNDIVGGYGVEGLEKPDSHGDGRYSDYINYINTGDTYSATILRDGSRYWIGTWGDIAERFSL